MIIAPMVFNGLLDNLADQFFKSQEAFCADNDLGGRIVPAAKKFFSLSIVCENLPENLAVLGVLLDDSGYKKAKASYTFTIYIDIAKITGKAGRLLFSLILAHELCHFAFYYELFLNLGADTTSVVFNNFKHTVSGTLEGSITKEKDNTRQTTIDENNITELLYSFGKYTNSHFAKKNPTSLDYREFFFHFLDRLNFGKNLTKLSK
jgi:hypothetical protein